MNSISVEVTEVDRNAIEITKTFGKGTFGETEFETTHSVPGMDILIEVGGKKYRVASKDIIVEVLKMHDKKI